MSSADLWQCTNLQHKPLCQLCWWHDCDGFHQKQWRQMKIQKWSEVTGRMTYGNNVCMHVTVSRWMYWKQERLLLMSRRPTPNTPRWLLRDRWAALISPGVHITEDFWKKKKHYMTGQESLAMPRLAWAAEGQARDLISIRCTFYHGIIKSLQASCITVWFGSCTGTDRKTL